MRWILATESDRPVSKGRQMPLLTRDQARDRGDELALADDHTSATWAELDIRVNRLINAMRSNGITTGDTIAILAGNRVQWFEATLACAQSGVNFVPVNWHLVPREYRLHRQRLGLEGDHRRRTLRRRSRRGLARRRLSPDRDGRGDRRPQGSRPRRVRDVDRVGLAGRACRPAVRRPDVLHVGDHRQPEGCAHHADSVGWPDRTRNLAVGERRVLGVAARQRHHRLVRAHLPLGAMGLFVPAVDHRFGSGDAAQVRQRRGARSDRSIRRHQHPPRADPDEATGRAARRREGRLRRLVAGVLHPRCGAVSACGQAGTDRLVGPGRARVLRVDRGVDHHHDQRARSGWSGVAASARRTQR